MRIFFKGKEVANPFLRLLAGLLALAVFALVLLLLLSLIGISVVISIGTLVIAFVAMVALAIASLFVPRRRKSRHPPGDTDRSLPGSQPASTRGDTTRADPPRNRRDER